MTTNQNRPHSVRDLREQADNARKIREAKLSSNWIARQREETMNNQTPKAKFILGKTRDSYKLRSLSNTPFLTLHDKAIVRVGTYVSEKEISEIIGNKLAEVTISES